jgi:hypothetical protein
MVDCNAAHRLVNDVHLEILQSNCGEWLVCIAEPSATGKAVGHFIRHHGPLNPVAHQYVGFRSLPISMRLGEVGMLFF